MVINCHIADRSANISIIVYFINFISLRPSLSVDIEGARFYKVDSIFNNCPAVHASLHPHLTLFHAELIFIIPATIDDWTKSNKSWFHI